MGIMLAQSRVRPVLAATEQFLIMKSVLVFCALTLSFDSTASAREWFVRQADANASDSADGSADHPLRTISAAAQEAQPGDVVTVGPGIYHEWVSPARSGAPNKPILYRSVPRHAAIVRGTDVLNATWQPIPEAAGVFSATLPQQAFVFGNPFAGAKGSKRTALVFQNDQPLLQVTTQESLIKTPNSWMSSDDGKQLLIHLQGDAAPAKNSIEITTRDRIFAPHRRGLRFIDVEGFIFERAATHVGWPQLGALSTRSGRFWTIRDNIVRQTTGKGIDCGSETWNMKLMTYTDPQDMHLIIGGQNLVEGNVVTDNAQCGIAAWNTDDVRIINNIVRNNASAGGENPKPPWSLADAEAAGIKVHAFRHGLLEGNLIEDNASFGIWLDNGWENARVTRNVAIRNRGAGIFVEFGFGPCVVDHNLCAQTPALWPPYFGDGIYAHDSSDVTITHNTLTGNAHYGLEMRVAAERSYGGRRLSETSNESIGGNLFFGNHDADIALPLESPRSHDNHSDHNALDPNPYFVINDNMGRIPAKTILAACRERLKADLPASEHPDADPKRVVTLSLPQWRTVMKMDENSAPLPAGFRMHLDKDKYQLQIDVPSASAIPAAPAIPTTEPSTPKSDDFDLLGQPITPDNAIAGAVQNLHAGTQTITVWPLPAASRPSSTDTK